MADQQIASVSLQAVLDWTKFDRDLESLNKRSLPKIHLTATVDDRALTALNKHLDLKEEHVKRLQRSWDSSPLTVRTELRELNEARTQLQSFNRELRDIRSQVGTKIQLEAEHTINIARLESALEKSVDRFEKTGDIVAKKISDRIANTKVKIDGGGIVGSIFGGISQGVIFALGQKIADGTSKKLDRSLNNFGLQLEKYLTRRGGRAIANISQDLGYRSTREFRRDVGKVGNFVDGFIDPKRVRAEGKRFEENLSKAAVAFFSDRQSIRTVFQQFVKNSAPSGSGQGFQEAAFRVAGFGLRQAAPAIRINKDVQLANAAKQAAQMAEQMEISREMQREIEKANAVVFAIGGLHQAQGKGGAEILKPQLERIMPGAYVQGVSNKYRDSTDAPAGIDRFLGRFKPGLTTSELLKRSGLENRIPIDYLKFLDTAAFSGATPEVIQAAAKIKALQKVTNKPVYGVGYSSGGADVADLVRLAEIMGNPIQGVGLGSPVLGIANRRSPNFTPVLGQNDHIYKALFQSGPNTAKPSDDVFTALQKSGSLHALFGNPQGIYTPSNAGDLHKLGAYLAAPNVQGMMRSRFPETMPSTEQMPSSLSGRNAIKSYDFIQYQAEQRFDRTLNKITEAQSTPSPRVRERLIEEIKTERSQYEQKFRKATGSIKEELNALLETLRLGISALETMQKSEGLPNKEIRKQFDEMNRAVGKYYDLADNNRTRQRDRFMQGLPLEPVPEPPKMTIAQKSQSIARRVLNSGGNLANQGGLALLNNKIASIEAFQDDSGVSPKVARFRDLSLRGYGAIAAQDTATVLSALQGTIGKGYGALKGVENFTLNALPFGNTAKGVLQNVAIPALAFNAATHMLPGGGAIAHGATEAVGNALQLPLGGLGEAVTVAVNNSLGGAIAQIPVVGTKLAPAMTGAITNLIGGAVENVATGAAGAITPVLGGQAMLSPVKAIGGAIVGDQSALVESTQRRMTMFKMGIDRFANQGLLSARPDESQYVLKGMDRDLKQIASQIDQGIATLAPLERTGSREGNQLAQLKGQITRTENKLNQLVNGLQQMVRSPKETMRSSMQGEIIDAQVIEPRQLKSAAIPQLPSGDTAIRQMEKDAIAQLKAIQKVFVDQGRVAKSGVDKSPEIAAEIQAGVAEARSAIDALLEQLGSNATKPIRDAATSARKQITRTSNETKSIAQTSELGKNFGDGLNQGLNQSIAGVKSITKKIADTGVDEIKRVWQIRSPSRIGQYLGKMFGLGINQGIDSELKSSKVAQSAKQIINSVQQGLTNGFEVFASSDLAGIFDRVKGSASGLIAIAGGFAAFNFLAPLMGQISQATLQTGLEFEALERRLSFVEGGADQGAERLRSLKSQSDELGLSFRESAESYANLAATTRDTPLQGFQTEQIAESLNILGSAYNFDRNRQNRFNVGFTQVLGKGKVFQEEIRQQLAEAAPGFTQLAARSYGVDVPELNRMIAAGVDSQDFAVRVSQQIRAELGSASDEGAKSAQGSINRLENAIAQLQGTVGKGILPGVAIGSEAAAFAINALATNIDKLLALLTAATFTVATFGAQGLFQLIKYNGGLLATFKALVPSIVSFRAAMSSALPIVGRFAAVLAAMGAFNIIQTALSDASGEFGSFADSAEKSMKRYEKALSKANGIQKEFLKSLPQNASEVKGKSWLESVPLIDMLPQDWLRNFEDLTIKGAKESSNPLNIFRFIPRRAEKENRDQMNALDRFLGINTVDRVNDQLSGKQNDLSQLQNIDRSLEQVRSERGAIAARRTDLNQRDPRLEALRSREQELLKQRETYIAPPGALQAELASRIETLEKAQETLSKMSQEGAITQEQYATQTKRVSDELAKAKSAQDQFNSAMRDSLSKMGQFERNMRIISDRSEDNQRAIQLRSEATSVNIANAELTGQIDRGTADSANQTAQQMALREQINEQRSQLAKMMAELQAQDAAKIFSQFGVSESTGVNELKTLIENTQGEREKKLLESLMQVRELEGKISQSESQLGQQFVQTKRAIDDSNRAVIEYYQSIQDQTNELKFELESMDLDTRLANTKNSIRSAMSGFSRNFITELGESIIDILETASGEARARREGLQQIQQRIVAARNSEEQGNSLIRGLPGAIDPMGMGGGAPTSQAAVGSKIPGQLRVTNRNDPDGSGYGFDYGVWEGGDSRGVGAPVVALAGGKVVEIRRNDAKYGMGGQRGFGNQVIIRVLNPQTGKESDVSYGHLNEINVVQDQVIGRGQRIGTQGETGSATAPHVTLNVFARGTGGGGAAEVALGRLLEQSVDRGTYANVGTIQQPQQRSLNNTNRTRSGAERSPSSNQQYRSNPNQAAGSGQPLYLASSSGNGRSPSQSSQNRIGSVGGFDANRINRSVAILQQEGLSPLAAAYLTGSFMQESGLNPNASNGTHRGIMQWDNVHRSRGMPSDFEGQVRFAVKEGMQDSPQHIRTLRDRNATPQQVRAAIEGITRWGAGEEKARFQYGAEIFKQMGGSSARPMNPTTGMTNEQLQYNQMIADNNAEAKGMISDAQQQVTANTQQATQAILKRSDALGKLARTEAEKKSEAAQTSFDRGLRERERALIEAGRERIDLQATIGKQTPLTQLQTELREFDRSRDDRTKQLREQYKDATQIVTDAEGIISAYDQLEVKDPLIEPIIQQIKRNMPELRRQRDLFKTEITKIDKGYEEVRADRISKFFEEITRSTEALPLQVAEFRDQMGITTPFEKYRTEIDRLKQSQIEFHRSYEATLSSLEGSLTLPNLTEEEKRQAQERIDLIKRSGQEYDRATEKAIEFKKAMFANDQLQASLGRDRQFLDSTQARQTAELGFLRYDGAFGGFERAEKEAEIARQNQMFELQKGYADLQRLAADPNSGFSADQIGLMRTNLERLNEVKLTNISLEVQTLGNVMRDELINQFTDGFTSILTGAQSFSEGFANILKNLGNKLISMGLNSLFSRIFGSIFNGTMPMNTGQIGGNMGGIVGGLINSLIPKFSEGGIIGEGRSPIDNQLILAQRGEAVITHRGVDLLGTRAIDLINQGMLPRFANGGMISGGMAPNIRSGTLPRMRSTGARSVTYKIETVLVGGQEFVTVEQFRSAIDVVNRRSEMNAENAISGHVESIQSSPGYRAGLGMS